MSDLRQLRFAQGKRLSELSDNELRDEVERRRAARDRRSSLREHHEKATAVISSAREATSSRPTGRARGLLIRREVKQYLLNLELEPGASIDAIRESYFRLREKYDPKRQSTDEKKAIAQKLTDQLRNAYEALNEHYEIKGMA